MKIELFLYTVHKNIDMLLAFMHEYLNATISRMISTLHIKILHDQEIALHLCIIGSAQQGYIGKIIVIDVNKNEYLNAFFKNIWKFEGREDHLKMLVTFVYSFINANSVKKFFFFRNHISHVHTYLYIIACFQEQEDGWDNIK